VDKMNADARKYAIDAAELLEQYRTKQWTSHTELHAKARAKPGEIVFGLETGPELCAMLCSGRLTRWCAYAFSEVEIESLRFPQIAFEHAISELESKLALPRDGE